LKEGPAAEGGRGGGRRPGEVPHLPGPVADDPVRAAAVDQALDSLVVVDAAVDQLDHEVVEEPGTCIGAKPPGTQADAATAPPSGKSRHASGRSPHFVRARIVFLSTSSRSAWSAVPCLGGSPMYMA